MIRKAFLIKAREGMAEEYKKRHNPIWPELMQVLKDYGVSNYSIFLDSNTRSLFGYLEVSDESLYARISESEVMQHWWKEMTLFLESDDDNSLKAREVILEEVFHLE